MLSRVADQLYWMSRYLERAEHTARVMTVHMGQTLEGNEDPNERWIRTLKGLGIHSVPELDPVHSDGGMRWLTFDPDSRSSVLSAISAARENARQVREQISSEMWEQLNRLYHEAHREAHQGNSELGEFLGNVINGSLLFQGVTSSTMNRGEGWRFIRLGQFLERAGLLVSLLDTHTKTFSAPSDASSGAAAYQDLLGLLKASSAFESYCKVHTARLDPDRIAEFLLLDREFPHSIRFAADQIDNALRSLPEGAGKRAGRLRRLAGKLQAQLNFSQIDEILASGIADYLREVEKACNDIHGGLRQVYISYPIETAIAN